MADVPAKLRHRVDSAALWAGLNPVLLRGELGFEEDTLGMKLGDGVSPWNDLPYRVAPGAAPAPAPSPTPAPPPPPTAPSITTQPAAQSVTEPATATFTVAASGTAPLAYQWRKDGTNIAGATSASYTTPATTTADSGAAYTVVVSNAAGSVTSAAATLTVAAAGPAPAPSPTPPDTRPRFGYGSATAGVDDPAALLASMTVYGTSNASKAGTFTSAPPAGQYVWAAFEAGVSASGVTFTVTLGPGGWQGASSPGPNFDDDGSSPNTSTVTAAIGGTTWRFFRTSFANAADTWTTS